MLVQFNTMSLLGKLKSWVARKASQFVRGCLRDWEEERLTNLRYALQEQARRQTAEWLTENRLYGMLNASTKTDLLERALAETPPDGLLLEFGVYEGASLRRIASRMAPRTVYGFDSFEGIPDGFGLTPAGHFRTQHPQSLPENVELVTGWFEDSLPRFLAQHCSKRVAFIHVDCDCYSSTRTVFSALEKRIQPGAIILFDELYNFAGWTQEEFLAWREFLDRTHFSVECLGGTWVSPSYERSGAHQMAFRIVEGSHKSRNDV